MQKNRMIQQDEVYSKWYLNVVKKIESEKAENLQGDPLTETRLFAKKDENAEERHLSSD